MIRLLLAARSLRAFADGYVAVLLPAYLLALGHGQMEVGILSTVALLGSALATLAVGRWGQRFAVRRLLLGAALVMLLTGLGFATLSALWPLLIVAFIGPLNPSGGDVSVFLPLEHTMLAASAPGDSRITVFARYSFFGSIFGAVGALAAAVPDWLAREAGVPMLDALRAMFALYAVIGAVVWALYLRLPRVQADANLSASDPPKANAASSANSATSNSVAFNSASPNSASSNSAGSAPASALGPSRAIVWRLAGLFSIDSFAGGFVANALLALWLFERFGLSLTAAGAFFFWTGLLSAASQLAAPALAKRIGLINTMVFTHIPASLCLIAAAFASSLTVALGLLLLRSALSQMDVPARSAFVMSVVTPAERQAAASFTAVPRSLASAVSPSISGVLFAAGAMAAPLVACGVLKIAYDIALFVAFRETEARGV